MIETWDFVFEVDQRWETVDTVLSGDTIVVDLDEGNSFLVALVVDVLQFSQDPLRFLVIVVV
jgi:hypothetical protein